MLDGRIDSQGTIADLKAQGFLEGIEHDSSTDVQTKKEVEAEIITVEGVVEVESKSVDRIKKPRKLIKDEHRETGGVKWSIYKSYIKASYVLLYYLAIIALYLFYRSYWIWGILLCIVVINQFLGLAEKLWVRVRFA